MDTFINKVIRASAGTGKTYRLSLEFIGLLLQFKSLNIHFSQILVITFTKKATAEIRERIFSHLENLIERTKAGQILEENLTDLLNLRITDHDRAYLRSVYKEMLTNKHQVQISTIDSFTQSIFKAVIAPYLGLAQFEIVNEIEDRVLDEVSEILLKDESLHRLEHLFLRSRKRQLDDYRHLVRSIIDKRWLLALLDTQSPVDDETTKNKLYEQFYALFDQVLDRFAEYLKADAKADEPASSVLKNDYVSFWNLDPGDSNWIENVRERCRDQSFLLDHHRLMLEKTFWNGNKCLRKAKHKELMTELSEKLTDATDALASWIFVIKWQQEEKELLDMAHMIIESYEKIAFRDKKFTHGDISYLTFRYLYDPNLSLVADGCVTNSFYEYLTAIIRFIMVDEFQDTSILQFRILLPMIRELISGAGIKPYGGVIIVGDEKQSIYGWRGGMRELLLGIPNILHDPVQLQLDTSFRSSPQVVEFINRVFGHSHLHNDLAENDLEWPFFPSKTARKNLAGSVRVHLENYAKNKELPSDYQRIREWVRKFLAPEMRNFRGNCAVLARKNSTLETIASFLDEEGLDYVLESANSLIDHRSLKPLMHLLRFLVYDHVYDLFCFLRSDVVLLDSENLKRALDYWRVLKKNNDPAPITRLLESMQDHPAVKKVIDLRKLVFENGHVGRKTSGTFAGVMDLVKTAIEEFNWAHHFPLESDLKNINSFIHIIIKFESDHREHEKSLKGFLDFCAENNQADWFKQSSLSEQDAVVLLSIHKAKGLEFDRVYVIWDFSSYASGTRASLKDYASFDSNFELQDFAMTFNYDYLLPHTPKRVLHALKENQKDIETLNTLYVALTRPKKHLFFFGLYESKQGLEVFLKNSDSYIDRWWLSSLIMTCHEIGAVSEQGGHFQFQWNELDDEISETAVERDSMGISSYTLDVLNYVPRQGVEQKLQDSFRDFISRHRHTDRGNVVHYYLSWIIYATAPELEQARQRTLIHYGNLLDRQDIAQLLDHTDEMIKSQTWLFEDRWNPVFTEYTIFYRPKSALNISGEKEIRIDRLMIDHAVKTIQIVDFKTGDYEEDQLDAYKEAIEQLSFVQEKQYRVNTRIVFIPLPELYA
ncbi:AAA family ATPase [candidate division KSB1 bacterium]|nr:AAA family ATPase [candidate division KSB1 bacterium]